MIVFSSPRLTKGGGYHIITHSGVMRKNSEISDIIHSRDRL